MSGIGVTITQDDATPLLERLHAAVLPAGISLIMARAVGIQVKDHLVALNAERHRFGRNYYAQAARSVTARGAGGFALVSVTQIGIRQRFYGGPIDPKNGQFLTIPACAEAYGKRAGDIPNLDMRRVLNPKGHLQWALVRRASQAISISRRKQEDGSIRFKVTGRQLIEGEVMFWLVRHVDQKADPTVLPTRAEMVTAALDAGHRRLQRLHDRATGGES